MLIFFLFKLNVAIEAGRLLYNDTAIGVIDWIHVKLNT